MGSRFTRQFAPEHHTGGHLLFPDDTGQAGDGGQGGAGADPGTGESSADDGTSDAPWKDRARLWETRANADKARAEKAERDLTQLRQSQMSDADKAIAQAREEGRQAALQESAGLLVTARVEAALAGRDLPDSARSALVEGLDHSRFTRDGRPDDQAIAAWADRVAPPGTGQRRMPDLGQGRRTGTTPQSMDDLIRAAAGHRRG